MKRPVPVVLLREDRLKRSRFSEALRGIAVLVIIPSLVISGALLIWMV